MKRIVTYLSTPKGLMWLNLGLVLWAVLLNSLFQVFCIPVNWALFVLLLCFGNTILFPISSLKYPKHVPLFSAINGFSFAICLYCIYFMEGYFLGYILLILFFGVGFAGLMPFFLAIQIVWKNLFRPIHKLERLTFLLAIFIAVSVLFFAKNAYHTAMENVENMKRSNFETLKIDYMTERVLGMHFIYHTRIEAIYDGWRPPLHDPLMVVGMRLNSDIDPLPIDLKERIALYKKFFPSNPIRFKCRCAPFDENGKRYHIDSLLD